MTTVFTWILFTFITGSLCKVIIHEELGNVTGMSASHLLPDLCTHMYSCVYEYLQLCMLVRTATYISISVVCESRTNKVEVVQYNGKCGACMCTPVGDICEWWVASIHYFNLHSKILNFLCIPDLF